jgi:hypothetical protein
MILVRVAQVKNISGIFLVCGGLYLHMCVCVCVCVWASGKRGRDRELFPTVM